MSLAVLIAVMVTAVTIGVGAERRWRDRAERGTRIVMTGMLTVVLPPVYLVLVSRLHVDLELAGAIAVGIAVTGSTGVLGWWIASRVLRLPRAVVGAVILAVILSNSTYFGLPLTRVMLGADDLGAAVAWDSLVTAPMFFLVAFAVGAAFGVPGSTSGDGAPSAGRRVAAFVKNPLLWAAVAGLVLPFDAPDWSARIAQGVVYALLPVGFLVVGVLLSAERRAERGRRGDTGDGAVADGGGPHGGVRGWPASPGRTANGLERRAAGRAARRIVAPEVALAVGLRLVAVPLLVLAVSRLAFEMPDGMLLQAAAPTGINGLLVAHRFGLSLPTVANAIVWSTALMTTGVVVVAVVG